MLALLDDQEVLLEVFADDEPAFAAAVAAPTDAEALALTKRVVHEPIMSRDDAACFVYHLSRLRGQILHQKLFEVSFADEADAGRVLLRGVAEPRFLCDLSHIRLLQLANREHRVFQLLLRQSCKEICLILAEVFCTQKLRSARMIQPRIVPRREMFRARGDRKVEKRAKLDFAVAEHVRIRRSSARVLL